MEEKKGMEEKNMDHYNLNKVHGVLNINSSVFHSRKHVQHFLGLAGPHINIDCIEKQFLNLLLWEALCFQWLSTAQYNWAKSIGNL